MRLREYLELQAKNNKQLNEWSQSNKWVDGNGGVHYGGGYNKYGPKWDSKLDNARRTFSRLGKDELIGSIWDVGPEYFTDNYCYKWCTGFQPDPTTLNFEFGKIIRDKFMEEVDILNAIDEQSIRATIGSINVDNICDAFYKAIVNYLDSHNDTMIVLWDDPDTFFGIFTYFGNDNHTTAFRYGKTMFEIYSMDFTQELIINEFAQECLKFATNTGDEVHDFYEGLKYVLNNQAEKTKINNRPFLTELEDKYYN